MWKKGGDASDPIEKKLAFLYENGRQEQVGKYLRNLNIQDENFMDKTKIRSSCERKHSHIMRTIKFDIRGVRNGNQKLYTTVKFVCYQLLMLAHAQLHIKELNSYYKYV